MTLEFVVDTLGRVEPQSVRVVRSSHAEFENAAIDVIVESVYRPGRIRGRAVRVLVQQEIGFRLQGGGHVGGPAVVFR